MLHDPPDKTVSEKTRDITMGSTYLINIRIGNENKLEGLTMI